MRMWRAYNLCSIGKFLSIAIPGTLLSFCGSSSVFAESEINISLSSDVVTLEVMPETFEQATQTVYVSTDNLAGYTVFIRASGGSPDLIHQDDASATIPTFTLPSGSTSMPVESLGYGYGYSIDSGANYSAIPALSEPSNKLFKTTQSGSGQHELTFGVKVSHEMPAGTYSNTVTLIAIANLEPCPADNICYYGNSDDETGVMSNQSASSNAETTLIPSNFSRPGYGFAGWNTELDGTGTNYGPSQTITTGDLSAEGLQLYARWIQSAGDLQGWEGCNSMQAGDITALTDTRDGNTYAVAKYPDGHCWMMENMRLDLSNPNVEINELTTNNPTADFATAANAHPGSTNSFCTAAGAACTDRLLYNTNNMNRNLTPAYDTNDSSSSWYSYGGYYNWYTATAGHGVYALSTPGAGVSGDLCPAGWRLPTGYNTNSDLYKLDRSIGGDGINISNPSAAGAVASNRWRTYPINFLYSGEQNGEKGYNRDISGGYNTANTSNAERSVNLWLRRSAISVYGNSTLKGRGQTIRCLAADEYQANGTIHYDSNGGTGVMADENNIDFITALASNNTFTRSNYAFISWNTKSDGSGTVVAAGGSVAEAANNMGITDGGTLTLYAIWKPIYTIHYNGNGTIEGATANVDQANLISMNNVTLVSPNYSYANHGFVGWSLDPDASSKLNGGQQVTIYGPNETLRLNDNITSSADENNTINMYAVWLDSDENHTLQTFGSTECNALNTGDMLALTDERDGNTYSVAKLADGHCWMTENLRLDPSTTAFDSTNTNAPTQAFIDNAPSSSSSNTLCKDNNSTCIDKIAFNANNLNRSLTPSYSAQNNSSSWYSYGMMYNWYTASAGNGSYAMASGNTAGDICPAGWRLPIGGSDSASEIVQLNNAVNNGSLNSDANIRVFPNNFIYSGDYNNNKPGGRGSYGRYWSSTAANAANAYRFGFTTTEVTPVRSYNKWDAFVVRCITQ